MLLYEVYECRRTELLIKYRCVTGRSQSAVCDYHGKLVAVGGCDSWNCTNTVEMYNPEDDKWMFISSMTMCRRGAGVATFKGMVTAFHSLTSPCWSCLPVCCLDGAPRKWPCRENMEFKNFEKYRENRLFIPSFQIYNIMGGWSPRY